MEMEKVSSCRSGDKGMCELAEVNALKNSETLLCGSLEGGTRDTSVKIRKIQTGRNEPTQNRTLWDHGTLV